MFLYNGQYIKHFIREAFRQRIWHQRSTHNRSSERAHKLNFYEMVIVFLILYLI